MRQDIRAWPHKASTENGNTRLLSNFPAEQRVGAGTLPMAIVFLSYLTGIVPKMSPSRTLQVRPNPGCCGQQSGSGQ